MKKIGITGSIAMGKSTVSEQLRKRNYLVFDADETVKELLENNILIQDKIRGAFPDSLSEGKIDKKKLGQIIFSDVKNKLTLESIIHPFVFKAQNIFYKKALSKSKFLSFYDIPLLFEAKQESWFDAIIVVSCAETIQKKRALLRGLSDTYVAQIMASQLPDEEKRRRGDFIIYTDLGIMAMNDQLDKILKKLECSS